MDIYLKPRAGRVFRSMVPLAGVSFGAFSDSYPGSSSQEVADVQGKLLQLGYSVEVTGSYDAATSAAVLDFRSKWKLPVVDAIDASVVTALGMAGRPEYNAMFHPSGDDNSGLAVAAFIGLIAWAVWG